MIPTLQLGGLGRSIKRPAGGAGSHRYWRLYITANNGDTYTGFGEMELRATVSGADLTTPAGAISASSSYVANPVTFAIDNDNTSAWFNNGVALPAWVAYDFGSGVTVGELMLYMRSGDVTIKNRYPVNFQLQHSDNNSTWTDALTVAGVVWSSGPETKTWTVP